MNAPTDRRLIHLAPQDNVAAAACALAEGETVVFEGRPIVVRQPVPTGHKIAVRPIGSGEKVLKYGAPIGSATGPIEPGQYVHTHNLRSDYLPTFARQ